MIQSEEMFSLIAIVNDIEPCSISLSIYIAHSNLV